MTSSRNQSRSACGGLKESAAIELDSKTGRRLACVMVYLCTPGEVAEGLVGLSGPAAR